MSVGTRLRRGLSDAVRRPAALVGCALLFAACGSSGSASNGSSTAPRGATSSSTPAQSASGSSTASGAYQNPVYADDFPDPALLQVGSTFHAYATQGDNRHIQHLTSPDLVHWTKQQDALPTVGAWAQGGNTWAPEVAHVGTGYVMFYVERDQKSDVQCIGRATASSPDGPFVDAEKAPLVCQSSGGGSIDPNIVKDSDGHWYLYWKNDGNCCSKAVHLWGQRLDDAAAKLVGKPVALMGIDKSWQGNLVEAPQMFEHGGQHVLFYSANNYASDQYATGYASCSGPLGPCTDKSDAPLIATDDVAAGPGHVYPIALANGSTWIIYHAWLPQGIGSTYPGRQLWLSPLVFDGATPQPIRPAVSGATLPVH